MFVNVDWFFLSHRLPIAIAAKKNEIDMHVYAEITEAHLNSASKFKINQSPFPRKSKTIFHIISEFIRCHLLIKNNKPDLIHAVTIKPIIMLGLIARLNSTPFVGAVSGLGPAFINKGIIGKLRLKAIVFAMKIIFAKNNSVIICQSENDANAIKNFNIISPDKISLINGSGVDVDLFSPLKKYSIPEKYILMSSRILRDKGIVEYCEASKIVRDKLGKEINFKLSGPIDSSSPSFISEKTLTELIHNYEVDYLGNRYDMANLLASCTIFVLPSYYAEGIPKVLLEAASCGVPVITTNHPGCRDAIIEGKTGILVPVRDSLSLAKAIIGLLENKTLLTNMGKNGRILAKRKFTDSAVVKSHYKIYKSILNT